MQPPVRTTRTKANPGLVDRPSSRLSNAVVTQEKAKKQQAAITKAEELRRRAAQVGEIEREIRAAQAETQPVGQGGRGKTVKKSFRRPGGNANVSSSDPTHPQVYQFSYRSPCLPTTNTGYKGQFRQEECECRRPI